MGHASPRAALIYQHASREREREITQARSRRIGADSTPTLVRLRVKGNTGSGEQVRCDRVRVRPGGMYDQMARVAITPRWVRFQDFGAGRMPRFLQELAEQNQSFAGNFTEPLRHRAA